MSEENKAVEIKDEDLEKVSGGKSMCPLTTPLFNKPCEHRGNVNGPSKYCKVCR